MPSRFHVAALCLALLGLPGALAEDLDSSHILFLHLRIQQDGSIRVLGSRTAPGKLKTSKQPRGRLKLELAAGDSSKLWQGAIEDPRVRHFEVEHPPGSGKLERRTVVVNEAEFMVRVPVDKRAVNFLLFEEEAVQGVEPARGWRKVLLSHPLPREAQRP